MRNWLFMVLSVGLALAGALLSPLTVAWADEAGTKTVMLDVDGMTCNTCPITVKRALKNVDGVTDVTTKYEGKGVGWAKVTYNPAKVKVDDLTFATEEAGYPSRPKP